MNKIGISNLKVSLGDEKVGYREVPEIEKYIDRFGMPDDEELWGWGHFMRSSYSYQEQVKDFFTTYFSALLSSDISIDTIIVCEPCRFQLEDFLTTLTVGVFPELGISDVPVKTVEGYDCVNIMAAIEQAGEHMKEGVISNVVVLAAERVENEFRRFRKYSLFSDASLAFVVSNDAKNIEYGINQISITQDETPPETTDGILMREIDKINVDKMLIEANLDLSAINQVCYINLYEPITEMKMKELGFSYKKIYTKMIKQVGHCYGIDPFNNAQAYFSENIAAKNCMLCASAINHTGALIIEKLS